MTITRRTLVLGAMTAPLAAQAQTPASPQSWPPANIRIVVAYPPGGSTDAIMRMVQRRLHHAHDGRRRCRSGSARR
jgi:tripartite-type tricarboxylate transporter receptor subunit TctC